MPENTQTVNEVEAASSVESSNEDQEFVDTIVELPVIPEGVEATSEETVKTETPETEVAEKEEKPAVETKSEEEKPSAETDDRFSQSPRFRQMNDRMKTAEQENKALQEQLSHANSQIEANTPTDFLEDYSDDDSVTQEFDENPKEFLEKFAAKIESQVISRMAQENQARLEKTKLNEVFDNYAEKNPSFDEMLDDGSLREFVQKNPGHNALSAHMALTAQTSQESVKSQIDEAVKKAVAETETKLIKNFKAKRSIDVLPSGPAATGGKQDSIPPELANPKAFGGITSVLAQRLLQRRTASL